jgi:hypothetical protein
MRQGAHCEKSFYTVITMCRQKLTRKRHACFNLALLINIAEPAQIHAKSRISTQHHSKEIVISIAPSAL